MMHSRRGLSRRWPKRAKAVLTATTAARSRSVARGRLYPVAGLRFRAHAVASRTPRVPTRAASKRELWPGTGNRESFRRSFFSRESIVLWTVRTYAKNRRKYRRKWPAPGAASYACVLPVRPPIFTGVAAGSQQQAVMDPHHRFLMCCGRCHRQPVLCGSIWKRSRTCRASCAAFAGGV